jgi:hypothetical protein
MMTDAFTRNEKEALEKSRHVTTCEECESPGAYSNRKEKKENKIKISKKKLVAAR